MLDLSKYEKCAAPCSKGNLWQRLMDWLLPSYTTGQDISDGKETICKVLMRRNGCFEIVCLSTEPAPQPDGGKP